MVVGKIYKFFIEAKKERHLSIFTWKQMQEKILISANKEEEKSK